MSDVIVLSSYQPRKLGAIESENMKTNSPCGLQFQQTAAQLNSTTPGELGTTIPVVELEQLLHMAGCALPGQM